jgi:hypothetical protein
MKLFKRIYSAQPTVHVWFCSLVAHLIANEQLSWQDERNKKEIRYFSITQILTIWLTFSRAAPMLEKKTTLLTNFTNTAVLFGYPSVKKNYWYSLEESNIAREARGPAKAISFAIMNGWKNQAFETFLPAHQPGRMPAWSADRIPTAWAEATLFPEIHTRNASWWGLIVLP